MNENQYLKDLLHNYLYNNLSHEEKRLFYDLVSSGEYDYILAEDILEKLNSTKYSEDLDLNHDVAEKIVRETLDHNCYIDKRKSTSLLKKIITYASIAALLAIVGFLFLDKKGTINLNSQESSNQNKIELISYTNSKKEIVKIKLSDGSMIDVYPESSLRYPKNFIDSNRIVYLTGTAFFQITKDLTKPFVVFSDKLKTRVLGTSFLINSNTNSGIEEVEVRTGRVEIKTNIPQSDNSISLILTPNQKVVYDNKTQQLRKTLVLKPLPIVSSYKNTTEGNSKDKFVYDQVLIPKILHDLELEYGVKIILKNDKLKDNVFTGELSDSDLFNKLEIICLSTLSSYEVDGVNIVIK